MTNNTRRPFPILTTKRLVLRKPTVHDDQEIFILRSHIEINRYLDRRLSASIEDAKLFIDNIIEHIDKNGALYWAITLSNQDVLIGTISLNEFSDNNDYCEIGYELLPNFQGQGIMAEAATRVIDFAFHEMNVQRIGAYCHPDNDRSIKLLEQLHFSDSHERDTSAPSLIKYQLLKSADSIK